MDADRGTCSRHRMQLFDDTDSLGTAVAEFVQDGLERGETVLLVTALPHWNAIQASLRTRAVDVPAHRGGGSLVVKFAADVLDTFMRGGRPDAALFDVSVGDLVRRLADRGNGLRVYGDMVDVLAREANLRGAFQLEQLWNGLLDRDGFALFCGYSASSFGHPRDANALRQICDAHGQVAADARDILGNFLLRSCSNTDGPDEAH